MAMDMDVDLAELTPQKEEVAGVVWQPHSLLRNLCEDSTGFVPRTEEYARLLAHITRSGVR